MIIKQREQLVLPTDPRLRAGVQAEDQTAHYLHREFANRKDVAVFNDLRLVDAEQPEHTGRPGVCQIDHLVLHEFGVFIIESKSVAGEVGVRDDGSGGDEWTRHSFGRTEAMPSPFQQARRQGEFLRRFLVRHREQLLGKVSFGLRTVAKLLAGTDQRGFSCLPIQIVVAISDRGIIRRNDWKEPTEPFPSYLKKADLVTKTIDEEIAKHKPSERSGKDSTVDYGCWKMQLEEMKTVAQFLASNHRSKSEEVSAHRVTNRTDASLGSAPEPKALPLSSPSGSKAVGREAQPSCRNCGGGDLHAKWGSFGYYWKCNACSANTPIPTTCSVCGEKGTRGKVVRIRKDGPKYYRACEPCGIEELIWAESSPG